MDEHNNEYNFDPITGQPIPKAEPVVPTPPVEEPASVEPRSQEPEVAPSQELPAQEPTFAPFPSEQMYYPPKPKREPKPLTAKVFIPVVCFITVFSLALGLVGGYFGAKFFGPEGLNAKEAAVIYKTTKLKDENGDTVTAPLTVPQVAELVKNSVVEITTEQIVTGSFMHQYVSEGAGSGVIITEDGYIVTNHHVIDGATNINVRLANGKEHKARLIGSDAKSDLAIIKIEATELTPAPYGKSSELKVGETVVAVGNPLGELGGTVTQGIISALDREITIDNTTMRLLQTDTAINPGNSGGGMFNTSGQLVGIVNAKSAGEEIEGLGFAIPIDSAAKVIEDLLAYGYVTGRVDPGFTFVEINDAMTAMMYRVNELGLYVSSVGLGSDAAKAGFQSGDYVVSIDGVKVSTEAEANAIIDAKSVGDTLTVIIKRSGKEETLTVTLTEYVPSTAQTDSQSPKPF